MHQGGAPGTGRPGGGTAAAFEVEGPPAGDGGEERVDSRARLSGPPSSARGSDGGRAGRRACRCCGLVGRLADAQGWWVQWAALALGAQLGCGTRMGLGFALDGTCAVPWRPCVTTDGTGRAGGALFYDFLANMLGCFLMGLLTENTAHQLYYEADLPVSVLPGGHWLQDWKALWLGLRVGFCGSLTTWASWNTQMVTMFAAGHGTLLRTQVVSVAFGYFIGFMTAVCSYVLGEQVALAIIFRYRHEDPSAERAGQSGQAGTGAYDRHRYRIWFRHHVNRLISAAGGKVAAATGLVGSFGDELQLIRYGEGGRRVEERFRFTEDTVILNPHLELLQRQASRTSPSGEEEVDAKGQPPPPPPPRTEKGPVPHGTVRRIEAANAAVVLLLAATTAGLLVGTIVEPGRSHRREWFALLVAPAGAILRWHLCSRYNGSMASWKWFPAGTFVSNLSASCISAACAAVILHFCIADGARGTGDYLVDVFAGGLSTGVAGSLSTVSTLAGEIRKMLVEYPRNSKAFVYAAATLAASFFAALGIYGWSAWAATSDGRGGCSDFEGRAGGGDK